MTRKEEMGKTIVKNLKDYKGYQVLKITENKGTRSEETYYSLDEKDGNNINIFKSLTELKKYVDDVL